MPRLTGQTPYFEVFDMNASLAFYRDILGFEVRFASPEVETAEGRFSHFVRLGRGDIGLMLNTAYDSNERPPDRSEPRWAGCRHVQLYVDCDDVNALYGEYTARGLVAPPPSSTGYGYLAFSAEDPDGHRLIFHQPLGGPPDGVGSP
jgi:catechol 2,3-dioxygenase-like lactoylglutathione lyase family enzyme